MLVDVHCHLTHEKLKNQLDGVLKRAKEKGVSVIVASGVNVPTNREVLELQKKYKGLVRCTLGLYPIDLLGVQPDETGLTRQTEKFDLDDELKFIEKHKDEILGVGECGLDYHWDKENHDMQKENFQKILDFVKKINKPIIIHTRKAEKDCIEMLEKSGVKKVLLHMFEGNKNLIKKAEQLGYFFSVPATIERSQHFRMLVEIVSISHILTETDAPWMSPDKTKPNEPANVSLSVKEIAKIKNMDEKEVELNIFNNYQRLFS